MKKILMLLMVAMLGVTSVMAANKVSSEECDNCEELVFKQTIEFEDDSDVVIYYVKQSNVYRVYSSTDLNKLTPKKLLGLKSFNVEKAETYNGGCYFTCYSLQEVIKTANDLFNKYKEYIL